MSVRSLLTPSVLQINHDVTEDKIGVVTECQTCYNIPKACLLSKQNASLIQGSKEQKIRLVMASKKQ